MTNFNTWTNQLAFELVGHHIWTTFVDYMKVVGFVTKYVYENIVAFVEQQCVKTTSQLL
jgi:hypothetical protein